MGTSASKSANNVRYTEDTPAPAPTPADELLGPAPDVGGGLGSNKPSLLNTPTSGKTPGNKNIYKIPGHKSLLSAGTKGALKTKEQKVQAMQRQLEEFGYKKPKPNDSNAVPFEVKKYAHVDSHPATMPQHVLYGNYGEVARYLVAPFQTDLEKARALFMWTVVTDVSDQRFTLDQLPDVDTPLEYLLQIMWKIGNHAHLFTKLCRIVGIPCVTVYGLNKNSAYRLGEPMSRDTMCSQWNAIYHDGNWRLIDIFWASTTLKRKRLGVAGWRTLAEEEARDAAPKPPPYAIEDKPQPKYIFSKDNKKIVNEFFFLTPPDQFVYTHFPDDPKWQLKKDPISLAEYEGYAYVRERYWQLNLCAEPNIKEAVITAEGGEAELKVHIPKQTAENIYFQCLMFRHARHLNAPKDNLTRYVFFEKTDTVAKYSMRFPVPGRFKIDIFGRDEAVHDNFDLCVSFLIDCKEPLEGCEPYPDNPDIGWGAGDEMAKMGVKALTHDASIIRTENGELEIRMATTKAMTFMEALKNNALGEEILRNNVMMEIQGDELVINLRLPNAGEYALNMYGDEVEREGSLTNLCNYLIQAVKDNDLEAFPKLYEQLLGKGFMADGFNVEAVGNEQQNIIKTESGKVALDFTADSDAELFIEIHKNGVDQAMLAQYVTYETDENGVHHFSLNLPESGEYAVNVFARAKGDYDQVYHAYTYLVQSDQKENKVLPKKPPEEIIEMDVAGELAVIRLPAGAKDRTANLQRRNAHDVILQDQVIGDRDGNDELFYVVIPESGEYEFQVYEENENGTITNVKTYRLTKHPADTDEADDGMTEEERLKANLLKAKEAREKRYREKLLEAMKAQDIHMIRKAIEDFERMNIAEENDELKRAIRLIQDLEKFQGDEVHLPDQPDAGWGCGDEAMQLGFKAITHQEALVKTETGVVEMEFEMEKALGVIATLKSSAHEDEELRQNVAMEVRDGKVYVKLRLPEKGDYALNLYAEEEAQAAAAGIDLPNVANYVIRCENDNEIQAFPKLHEFGLGASHVAGKFGVTPKSDIEDIIKTEDGSVKLDFHVPENFELLAVLHNNQIDDGYLAKVAKVTQHPDSESAEVNLTLPQAGEYAMNLYIKDKNDPNQIHHVHTYLVASQQTTHTDCPKMGDEVGSVPMVITGENAIIPIKAGPPGRTTELIRMSALGEPQPGLVSRERQGEFDLFTVKLSELGEYRLQVFDQNTNGSLKMVQEYQLFRDVPGPEVVKVETRELTEEELQRIIEERSKEAPLPDTPAIGWGPGDASHVAGLKAVTHAEPVIETHDGEVEIRFTKEKDVHIMQNLKTLDLEDLMLKQNAIVRVEDEEVIVNVRVPDEGEYALKLYGDLPNTEGELPNVCNYLIKSLKKNRVKNFPKFHLGGLGKGFFADKYDIKALSHPGGKIQTELGVVGIEFETNDANVELAYEICNNELDNHLSDCVKVKSEDNERHIDLILPQEGEYALNVYARLKHDPTQVYHVHTYLIESFQTDTQELPPASPQPRIQTIRVTTDKATIKVPSGKRARTCELLKKNALGQEPDHVKIEYDNKIDIYEVKLPELGEYRFDIFEDHGNGTLDHIRHFQIFRDEPQERELSAEDRDLIAANRAKEERRRQALAKLQAAILKEDELMLKVAMNEFKAVVDKPNEEPDLIKAKKLLEQLELVIELEAAMKRRSLETLQALVKKADTHISPCKKLQNKANLARHRMEYLMRLEQLRHDVLNMDAKAYAEIKHYSNPPDQVKAILQACLVLVGEDERKLGEWKTIVTILKRMGKGSLKRRIAEFRVEILPINIAVHVEKMTKTYTLDDVRRVSAGAGTFYVWVKCMVEESINLYIESAGDIEEVRKHVGKMKLSPGYDTGHHHHHHHATHGHKPGAKGAGGPAKGAHGGGAAKTGHEKKGSLAGGGHTPGRKGSTHSTHSQDSKHSGKGGRISPKGRSSISGKSSPAPGGGGSHPKPHPKPATHHKPAGPQAPAGSKAARLRR